MKNEELQDLISVSEASKRAGVARNTLYLAIKQGNIKCLRIGRSWFIHASDIARWKEEHYRPDMAHRYPPDTENDTDSDSEHS